MKKCVLVTFSMRLWIPDLFMKRVAKDADWTLMCPDVCPGLSDCYGEKFEELYTKYEKEGKGIKTIKARDVWFKILDAQMETGTLTCFTKMLVTQNQIKNLRNY